MKRIFLTLLLQCVVFWGFAQFTLKGTVKTEKGERLVGANLMLSNGFNGTTTDVNGAYQFKNLKTGVYQLAVTFIGYEKQIKEVKLTGDQTLDVALKQDNILAEEVLVSATRVKEKTPVAFATVENSEIRANNMGQDIPYLLGLTPSFVTTSDAGTGVGYTNFRIRGTDLNRINVTVNGIPMNDAESHGTWWVDIPDLASSTDNIQVQRGVGTSTNGAAAFGATINLQTTTISKEAFAEYSSSAGSFGTLKNSVGVGTGLLKGKFTFDARLSKVSSDGFIDRASSDLKSFFVSGGYFTDKTILKLNVFSGLEDTYQAWNGVPSVRLNNDLAGMQRYADHYLYSQKQVDEMISSNNRTYNLYTYPNQVDYYQQDHYQLLFSHQFSPELSLNANGFYTKGKGYYEEYKNEQKLADYLITPPVIGSETITNSDLIRRKWLDNDFYGVTFSINRKQATSDFTFGGGYNVYDGNHFGKVIWARNAGDSEMNHEWYRGTGLKKDFNVFAKYNYELAENLNLFADFQYRKIDYSITGLDDDLRDLTQKHNFEFFNPKVGLYYQLSEKQNVYINFARANREPNRANYVDADPKGKQPTFETLNDFELGYKYNSSRLALGVNAYFMSYLNQLILTGEINDVGAPIMTNVDNSYRAGLELMAGMKLTTKLKWDVNLTLSQNKIKDFTDYVDDWDNGGQIATKLGTTDLAFSPDVIANSQLSWMAAKGLNVSLQSYSVSKQYIDNTSSNDRKLNGYFLNNLKFTYHVTQKFAKEFNLHLMVNNLFDTQYENNAWVYSYVYEGQRWAMDGYFPQAGINFMVGLNVKF
ncbi:thiamin-regulated outer membrane receptor Omr1 [Aquipluma nitroreducens]|uniref:Thiamin-regulated outer membrane receptor Omr1 n=1 Tax=Aquipluma nitroreducens TaxID=2010828 RepID=A0A5K7SC55_9BACT|nr:TonB-dependent receptor [Aquipluma nitroreducens]BBE19138.1 thiamin-regulated outer membrane receptor Omr1 [Aquipluma nitroreducens]